MKATAYLSRKWTEAEDRMLRAFWPTPIPARALGNAMGRNKDMVAARARRLGLPPRAGAPALVYAQEKTMETKLRKLLKEIGWSGIEVARRVGKPRSTVQRWLDGSSATPKEVIEWLVDVAQCLHGLPPPRL